jgi:predicted sulfurtransferase
MSGGKKDGIQTRWSLRRVWQSAMVSHIGVKCTIYCSWRGLVHEISGYEVSVPCFVQYTAKLSSSSCLQTRMRIACNGEVWKG